MKTGRRFEEVNQLRDKFETFLANEIFKGGEFSFKSDLAIPRFEHDTTVIARFDLAIGTKGGGEIYCRSPRVKQIERPDVDRAAGKINARRCRSFN